jgi:hypothetical protein
MSDGGAATDATTSALDGSKIVDAGCGDACAYLTLPKNAIDAGYLTNTLHSTFTTSNVDVGATHATGFDWYPWNLYGTADPSKIVVNADKSITLEGDTTGPNGELVSGARGGTGFVGTAFGGGGYFEATFKFDPNDTIDAGYAGWPSWWSIPVDHIVESAGTWWNGDAATNYNNDVEVDYFEYDIQGRGLDIYGATIHDWYGTYETTCPGKSYCDWRTPNAVSQRTVPTGTDFTKYHSAGYLWVPATSTTPGSATFYFDRVLVGATTTWNAWTDLPPLAETADGAPPAPPSPQPAWALSTMDQEHYFLVLGTGPKEPMTVQEVDVWQASDATNIHH